MPLLTEAEVVAEARRTILDRRETAREILVEAKAPEDTFDVFLSHSSHEPERIILGIKSFLEKDGLSVYVDKYTDPQISPDKVTVATAELLRHRLNSSSSLIYIYSSHSQLSRWMPWELGFMDGLGRKVGVAPVLKVRRNAFVGEDFLGLYPYLSRSTIKGTERETFWIKRSPKNYAMFSKWINGTSEIRLRP
ncbi:hypothetical protein FF100_18820 [Methylobacterium terricola]|uniref:TIR domain-containing protein n=1 Tax=Methylobacterium terricola TaxID=2583531 RepID=A0A5C4LI33_9HYPH|nr:hypothetical protein [Methylobacterium terricola]TNC11690.1 hypothetical protein FF100_18820 [Methylobacterium terricola]